MAVEAEAGNLTATELIANDASLNKVADQFDS
jgi:hypothetical protein